MEWFVNNWYYIVIGVAALVYVSYKCIWFYKLPNSEKVKRIKACILALVTEAARRYDDGEADLLIADVYNSFCDKFPFVKTFLSVDTVNVWITEALNSLKTILVSEGKTMATFGGKPVTTFLNTFNNIDSK